MERAACAELVVSLLVPYLLVGEVGFEAASGESRSAKHNLDWLRCQTLFERLREHANLDAALRRLASSPTDTDLQQHLQARLSAELARDDELVGDCWRELIATEGRRVLPMQTVMLPPLESEGYILDIGGGGEGVIGQLGGQRVVAIDSSRRELEEAPLGPLKIVMDARELKFLSESFDVATCFFALMYMDQAQRAQVVQEIARVLRPGGRLLVWDATIPEWSAGDEDDLVVPLLIQLPESEAITGYGVVWAEHSQTVDSIADLASSAGLRETLRQVQGDLFHLVLRKP